jgi:Intracellular proteinase inhibitor
VKTSRLLSVTCLFAISIGLARAADPSAATPAPSATPAPKAKQKKADATPAPGMPQHPGLFNRIYHTLHLAEDKPAEQKKEEESKLPQWKHLALVLTIDPQPMKLSETHQFKVTLKLENLAKKPVQIDFPTSQRIEVLVKNSEGKMIEQWSEGQTFTNEPGVVSVNPGERLEYGAMLSTRGLNSSQRYTVEGFFPNYESLHSMKELIPLP